MQTFLPQIGYADTMRKLDVRRLEKQITEVKQILMTLEGESTAWVGHPAVRMWKGYERSLCIYGALACLEWRIGRKHNSHLEEARIFTELDNQLKAAGYPPGRPPWVGNTDICRSHRSNLIRRDARYAQLWPNTPELMPFLWPLPAKSDPRGYRIRLSTADLARLSRGERKLPGWLMWDQHKREVLEVDDAA